MQEWPDDKLDEFFRKLSEELDVNDNPTGWNRLKKRLDEVDGKSGIGWKKPAAWLAVIGLLVGLAVWYPGRQAPQAADQLPPAGRSGLAPETILPEGNRAGKPAADTGNYQQVLNSGKGHVVSRPESAVQEKTLSRRKYEASGVLTEHRRRGTDGSDGTILITGEGQSLPGGGQVDHTPEVPAATLAAAAVKNANVHAPEMALLPALPVTYAGISPQLPLVQEERAAAPAALAPEWKRWNIRLGIAPDFSAVRLPDFSRSVLSASVLLEYRMSPRWALQAGVVRDNKVYAAGPGYYQWPESWSQPVTPESVDGACRILEVPLNLKYDFYRGETYTWSVSTGVSSYRMLHEKYQYRYETPDPSIRWYQWEGATGWYWGSHLNASVGYERRVTKRFSVVLEPYARIPVQKVGFGRVNLFSAGAWLYVKYNLK